MRPKPPVVRDQILAALRERGPLTRGELAAWYIRGRQRGVLAAISRLVAEGLVRTWVEPSRWSCTRSSVWLELRAPRVKRPPATSQGREQKR